MKTHSPAKTFSLGQTIVSSQARAQLHPQDVDQALQRHAHGDWGDLASQGAAPPQVADWDGFRLVSAYRDRRGTGFLILTEADRSATQVLVAEDF
jgi:hypothetical protein